MTRQQFTSFYIEAYFTIKESGKENFRGCRIPVPSCFNFDYLYAECKEYEDRQVVELLRYGFPVGHDGRTGSKVIPKNHTGAIQFPEEINRILDKEIQSNSILGPFNSSLFGGDARYSPLNTVPKQNSQKRRLILDISFPPHNSINLGIDKDDYLGIRDKLTLPSIDKLVERIQNIGPGCKIFKIDLARGYRQFYLDPASVNLVGYVYQGKFYHNCMLSMGSKSSARCCQRVMSMVVFIHAKHGYFAINPFPAA